MTERDQTSGIDRSIRCDICGVSSGYGDSREPWECFNNVNPKPFRCETCVKAVKDATEQRANSLYPTITFPTKAAAEEYDRHMKSIGFYKMYGGPTLSHDEVKKRRFKK
jgi:hypothetical protein